MTTRTFEESRSHGDDERLLRPAEVAALFGVSVKAVARWADSGGLPSLRTPGGHRRFRTDDVQRLLDRGFTPGPEQIGDGEVAAPALEQAAGLGAAAFDQRL